MYRVNYCAQWLIKSVAAQDHRLPQSHQTAHVATPPVVRESNPGVAAPVLQQAPFKVTLVREIVSEMFATVGVKFEQDTCCSLSSLK